MLPAVGVFGTSSTIRCYVPILKSCGFKVVALWGRIKEEAGHLARDLNIPFSTDKEDEVLLHKDVDVVVISCPPHMQSPIVLKALRIGKHVLCSAPVSPSPIDALHMVQGARYYPGLMSLVVYGLRCLPTMCKMKEFVEGGYVGNVMICEVKVHYAYPSKEKFDWTCDDLMGGGVLNTIGGNIIDMISFLTAQKAIKVNGMMKTYTKQTEKINGIREITSDDFCTFQMDLDQGACATVILNSHMPGQFLQEFIIIGDKGRLVAKGADLYGQKHDGIREELIHFDPINFKEEERYGISEKVRTQLPTPYLKGIINMLDAVKEAFEREENRQSFCRSPVSAAATFEDSLYVQTVVDAIKKSSRSKEWVKVSVMKEDPDPNPFLSSTMRKSTVSLQ